MHVDAHVKFSLPVFMAIQLRVQPCYSTLQAKQQPATPSRRIQRMHAPSVREAADLLNVASRLNPGPWTAHSEYVAAAAESIAHHHPRLDPSVAFSMGLLHDIGRREGVTQMRHALDGSRYLENLGYPESARICLSHSYPNKNLEEGFGSWDCLEDKNTVGAFLQSVVYDDYDRLIQLCDTLALPSGYTLLEKRMIDVALRYDVNENIVPKWKKVFDIKRDFEEHIGGCVYSLLPGIVQNTFDGLSPEELADTMR